MKDENKEVQIISEVFIFDPRVAELEVLEAECNRVEGTLEETNNESGRLRGE